MEALANLNGELMPLAQAKISPLDRGFLFGDAVYEVLRVYESRPWLEEDHFLRLERSLTAIRISGIDLGRLRRRMRETIAAGPFKDAVVYIQITRGAAPRTHPFPAQAVPLEFLFVQEFLDTYQQARRSGGRVITQLTREAVKARIAAARAACEQLAPGPALSTLQSEIERVDEQRKDYTFWHDPDEAAHVLAQQSRWLEAVSRIERLRLWVGDLEGALAERTTRSDLAQVSELFLTGTTSEVLPVVRVDDQPIGEGRPGPVTRRLQEVYEQAVREFVAGRH